MGPSITEGIAGSKWSHAPTGGSKSIASLVLGSKGGVGEQFFLGHWEGPVTALMVEMLLQKPGKDRARGNEGTGCTAS